MFMGQDNIYNFLREHTDEWFTAKELGKRLNVTSGSVAVCLKKLRERNEVLYNYCKNGQIKCYLYKFKGLIP